ncbi:hypothetical protein [Clostridium cellulovorans]|uniref:Uncharacterized protein n=1 Tax=Clostridium cellulovorans (strain ATCC 35296 / DSM 3052 / OCM 3 / 743B) TaxID=573061 RepID=D9SWF4_CLOC7|nr:hypothetical protein [Clostridium cellulovorans]ADL53236.1 hypothetical protein Clocel_3560 [Clostridium cellulovorans 743B]
MRHKLKTYVAEGEGAKAKIEAISIKKAARKEFDIYLDYDFLYEKIYRDKSEKTSYKHNNKSYKGYKKPVRVNTLPQQQSFLNKLIGKIKRWLKCA